MNDSTYYIKQCRLIQKLKIENKYDEATELAKNLVHWTEQFNENNPMTFPDDAGEKTYDGKKVVGVFLK